MKSINVGVSGLGRGFMLTLPALRESPLLRLRAAFDLRTDAVARFAEEFSAASYGSLAAMLDDPDIDAVYVATPHEHHAEQAIASLEAGKHVLVEKPMAIDVRECLRMVQAAKASGKILVVGPSHAYDAPVRKAANLVASGQFGAVRLLTSLNFTDFMYRPRRPEEFDEARGGGAIFNQAAHQIDVARRIVRQPVTSIRAVSGSWDESRPGDGAYSALVTFGSNAAATLTYSGYAHYDSDELVGWISELGRVKDPSDYGKARRALLSLGPEEEARAKLSRTYRGRPDPQDTPLPPHHEHFGFLLVSCEGADLKVLPTGIEIHADTERTFLAIDPPTTPRSAVIEEFAAAIAGNRPPVHDGEWGLATTACCAALAQSSKIGADVDPDRLIKELSESDA